MWQFFSIYLYNTGPTPICLSFTNKNPDFKHVIDKVYIKSSEDINKQIGFLFWTEFFAYYKCFENDFLDVSDEDTFSKIVQNYTEIIKTNNEIKETLAKDNYTNNVVQNYIFNMVLLFNNFLHNLARFIATIPFRKKTYDYTKNNKKEYIEVKKITDDLTKLIHKMTNGTYGKHMCSRLSKIGTYINSKMLSKFNLEAFVQLGKVRYRYEFTKEIEEKSEGE